MSIGPGAIMGRLIATKLRGAISNWRKNKKETNGNSKNFYHNLQLILNADTSTPANRVVLKNFLVIQFENKASILIHFAEECIKNSQLSTALVDIEVAPDNAFMWNKRGLSQLAI